MERAVRRRRWALLVPVAAAGSVLAALVAERRAGTSPVDGYLSDLGADGGAGAGAYLVGLGLAALAFLGAAALAAPVLGRRDARVGLLLGGAAALAAQTLVRCEGACRLPTATGEVPAADVVHVVVAASGFALWAAAPALDAGDPRPLLGRASPLVAAAVAAHLAALGLLVVVDPYGGPAALLQRSMVLVVLGWVAGVALVAARAPGPGSGGPSPPAPLRRRS